MIRQMTLPHDTLRYDACFAALRRRYMMPLLLILRHIFCHFLMASPVDADTAIDTPLRLIFSLMIRHYFRHCHFLLMLRRLSSRCRFQPAIMRILLSRRHAARFAAAIYILILSQRQLLLIRLRCYPMSC